MSTGMCVVVCVLVLETWCLLRDIGAWLHRWMTCAVDTLSEAAWRDVVTNHKGQWEFLWCFVAIIGIGMLTILLRDVMVLMFLPGPRYPAHYFRSGADVFPDQCIDPTLIFDGFIYRVREYKSLHQG